MEKCLIPTHVNSSVRGGIYIQVCQDKDITSSFLFSQCNYNRTFFGSQKLPSGRDYMFTLDVGHIGV